MKTRGGPSDTFTIVDEFIFAGNSTHRGFNQHLSVLHDSPAGRVEVPVQVERWSRDVQPGAERRRGAGRGSPNRPSPGPRSAAGGGCDPVTARGHTRRCPLECGGGTVPGRRQSYSVPRRAAGRAYDVRAQAMEDV